eukprot:11939215-Alexandrium_andersonii.AAC.1
MLLNVSWRLIELRPLAGYKSSRVLEQSAMRQSGRAPKPAAIRNPCAIPGRYSMTRKPSTDRTE